MPQYPFVAQHWAWQHSNGWVSGTCTVLCDKQACTRLLHISLVLSLDSGWGGPMCPSPFVLQATPFVSARLSLPRVTCQDSPDSPGADPSVSFPASEHGVLPTRRVSVRSPSLRAWWERHGLRDSCSQLTRPGCGDQAGLPCCLAPLHIMYWFCLLCVISSTFISQKIYSTSKCHEI